MEEGMTFSDFLTKLVVQVDLHAMNDSELARVMQLMHKTNQFNTTTRRLPETRVQAYAAGKSEGVLWGVREGSLRRLWPRRGGVLES